MNNHKFTLPTPLLALRPGEVMHFSEQRYDQSEAYVVMLCEVPAFPGASHPEAKNLSVICAGQYSTEDGELDGVAWGWVHLDPGTKELVGHGLEAIGAQPGKWYYMLLSGGLGNRPREHFEAMA